jgi:hypothetical protein
MQSSPWRIGQDQPRIGFISIREAATDRARETDHEAIPLPKLHVMTVDELFGLLNSPFIAFARDGDETIDTIFIVQKIDLIFHVYEYAGCLLRRLKSGRAKPRLDIAGNLQLAAVS